MIQRCTTVLSGFFSRYWKWLLPIAYILTFYFWVWPNRYATYSRIPLHGNVIVYAFFDIILNVLALSILLLVIHLTRRLRTPILWGRRFYRACLRAGLCNSAGGYPTLLYIWKDKDKQHGYIFELNNAGLSLDDFKHRMARLDADLNISISRVDYGNKPNRVLLYAIPRRHEKPLTISPNDEFLGNETIGSLINCLVVGATGTGKTVALKVLMTKISEYQPTAKIYIMDFKHHDFRAFSDLLGHYGYLDCVQGLNDFYSAFKEQQSKGVPGIAHYLLFDEWGAFILSQEKKEAERLKGQLAELLMLGRSYKFCVIVGMQRADAEHFKAGARDQFRAILGLGNLSRIQKQFLFADHWEKMDESNGLGEGYLLIDGQDIERVKIAPIQDFGALNDSIRKAMKR